MADATSNARDPEDRSEQDKSVRLNPKTVLAVGAAGVAALLLGPNLGLRGISRAVEAPTRPINVMKRPTASAIRESASERNAGTSSKPSRLPSEYRVVSEAEAAGYCDLSFVYFRCLRREKMGPRYVRPIQRRIGYRLVDVLKWLEDRLR